MKILKHGKYNKKIEFHGSCYSCKCEFIAEPHEVEIKHVEYGDIEYSVKCPDGCNSEVSCRRIEVD